MSEEQTPQEQAEAFIVANDKSPVVSGHVIGNGGQGGVYTLECRTKHRLGRDACRLLPDGYPRWRLQ